MVKPQIILTDDGSHTIIVPELDETYHSIHGAIQESKHVFIEAGLNYWLCMNASLSAINILEFGFGTGLNALLTMVNIDHDLKAIYHTLEKHPLSTAITEALNYGGILHETELFNKIHNAKWNEEQVITPNFSIKKIAIDFRNYVNDRQYDIIYFDAFAPSKQPELWTKEIFEYCYRLLHPGGVFVTYSAKGQLKRDLKAVGFKVESLPGPPFKFEITRALKLKELTE